MVNLDNLQELQIIGFFIVLFIFVFAFFLNRKAGGGRVIFDFSRAYKRIKDTNVKTIASQEDIYLGDITKHKKLMVSPNTAHYFICGTTGSGKTVAISNFIECGVNNNYPLLVIDGKGDLGAGSLRDIVERYKGRKKIYIVDFNNPASSTRYNPFKNTSPTVIKDMLVNLTEWSEEHYKTNTGRYLQKLIEIMLLMKIPLSLKNIAYHLPVKSFEGMSAELMKAEVISKDEHLHNMVISQESGKISQGASARFSAIAESELGPIFDDSGIDIYTALQERAIILFVLNPLMYPELSPLIGNLVIIDSKKAISKIFGGSLGRIFFIMDEINVYASKSLLDLVNKSRSAEITCVLASQSLSDLDASTSDGTYFKEQVIENCNNYVVLRQNSATNAEQWANIIGTRETMDVTYQIKSESTKTDSTGMGTAKLTREFIFHPDDIKNLKGGQALFVSKDKGIKTRVSIRKPF